jgi:hypothetical protein
VQVIKQVVDILIEQAYPGAQLQFPIWKSLGELPIFIGISPALWSLALWEPTYLTPFLAGGILRNNITAPTLNEGGLTLFVDLW